LDVKISLALGIAVSVLYLVIIVGGRAISGVENDEIDESASNIAKGFLAPLVVACAFLLVGAFVLGAWTELFKELPPLRITGPMWLFLVPVLFVCAILAGLVGAPWDDFTSGAIALLLLSTLLIGFGEELAVRGYLLVGARSVFGEAMAWFVATFLFAVFHFGNIVTGAGTGDTTVQVVLAFLSGSSLYLIRRLTGALYVGMIIHALFDFSAFAGNGAGEGDAANSTIASEVFIFLILMWVVTVPAMVFVFRFRRQPIAQPAT
jgi:CAAX protease family protein